MTLGSNLWSPPPVEAAEEFYAFSKQFSEYDILKLYSANHSMGSLNSNNRANEITSLICSAIDSGTPYSLVRMSDGEGNCLFTHNKYPELKRYILERISYIHFGENLVVPAHFERFLEMMNQSILSADVVCVPEHDTIKRGFHTQNENVDVRAVVGNRTSAISISNLINPTQITSSAWTNRHLLGYYEKIFGNRDCVGIVTSYPEIADLMQKHFRIGSVIRHIIPRQAVFLNASDRKNSFHYPETFEKIVKAIDPIKPGMPYLVSGGLLAKHYCHLIKSRGGVAIDTGTVPEIWLGIPNRGLSADFINKWKLI